MYCTVIYYTKNTYFNQRINRFKSRFVCESAYAMRTPFTSQNRYFEVDIMLLVMLLLLWLACYDICETHTNLTNRQRNERKKWITSIELMVCVTCQRHSHKTHTLIAQANKQIEKRANEQREASKCSDSAHVLDHVTCFANVILLTRYPENPRKLHHIYLPHQNAKHRSQKQRNSNWNCIKAVQRNYERAKKKELLKIELHGFRFDVISLTVSHRLDGFTSFAQSWITE